MYRLRIFILLIILLADSCTSKGGIQDRQPNVLLILVDDLKPALGCYGDEHALTPNIDRLAACGILFETAYCNQAVCAPSRNNLMLGSLSTSIGVYSLGKNFRRAVPDAVTLTQYFMDHGYRVEGIGKVFHIGHGNHDDTASWSVPFQTDLVVEYLREESRNGGTVTKEEAYFGNMGREVHQSAPRGAAWECVDVPGNPADSADIELYDYHEDPLESKNLATARPDIVKELLITLNQYPLKE